MKFTINKTDIVAVLSKVQGLAGRKTNLAITTNVLIQSTQGGLLIKATDLETGFEGIFPASIEAKGQIAINGRKLYEIVREFPDDQIQFAEMENHWIKIGNDNVEFNLVGMNPEDFPEIPKIEDGPFLEMDMHVFHQMIDKSIFIGGAADDRRAHITGIYLETLYTEAGHLFRMVSTDGSRLSKVDHPFDSDPFIPVGNGVLVPKKGLSEVVKFLEQEGTVRIGLKDNNFVVKKESETIIIRMLEGDFPEYKDIIQKGDHPNEIKLDRQLFLMMLKRMSILSSDDYRSVIFTFADDSLNITSTNPEIGESKETMNIAFTGEKIEVAFNPKFFIETLNVIDEESAVLYIEDSEKPCMIQGQSSDRFLTVIMPMRI